MGEGVSVDTSDESINIENESGAPPAQPANSAPGGKGSGAEQFDIDGRLMTAALKAVDKGIEKGIRKDFASYSGIEGSIISGIFRGLALMTGSTGRLLERRVKTESTMEFDNNKVNENSKRAFQQYIIQPSKSLYSDNFEAFMNLVKNTSISKNITNNTSETKSLAIEYKSLDESARTTDFLGLAPGESPHKLILNKLIPLLRSKFDAIVSFKEKVGAGSSIDYEGVGARFSSTSMNKQAQEGQVSIEGVNNDSDFTAGGQSDDIVQLGGLYRAIDDWWQLVKGLDRGGSAESVRDAGSDENKSGATESGKSVQEGGGGEAKLPSFNEVVKGIEISRVRPGGGSSVGATPGEIVINRRLLDPTNIPVVSLVLTGPMARYVKPVGKDMDYFLYFMKNNKIKTLKDISTDLPKFITNVSSENTSEGAKLTIYFNPSAILQETAKASDLVKLMNIRTVNEDISIMANNDTTFDDLVKLSSASSTTPLYETVSPSGEAVAFTPADLVLGGGRLRDSKGNKFKVKKRKGKSLSDRVVSSDFGKVKRGLK